MRLGSFDVITGVYRKLIGTLSDKEFDEIRAYAHKKIGIRIRDDNQSMVVSRLAKRLRHHDISSYGEYFQRTIDGSLPGEEQIFLDLLTTNETYLFREPKHFYFLRDRVLTSWDSQQPFRIWSAACSTGEEAYSIAMVLSEKFGNDNWEVLASDVSERALTLARRGKFKMARFENTPQNYLREYCKRGVMSEAGSILIRKELRSRVQFRNINLVRPAPRDIGMFDAVFLRNTLYYFDEKSRAYIIDNVLNHLKDGGYLCVSHTETLAGIPGPLSVVTPSVYQKHASN